uniref:N(4)-(beta-N-acetylglucosaminyl)-L-asparaginase n=1 Tax=Acrobeloides nanus TaxID=290746 RepID=A0A914CI47_9BILA
NVTPDPRTQCGPYNKTILNSKKNRQDEFKRSAEKYFDPSNHDTLGMVVIDINGGVSAGTSTNGARNKIPGRVGDSPIPGAGAFADETGGAAETGDGDVMMRFLPSYLTVEKMRDGCTPTEAAQIAILRVRKFFPTYMGAIVAANKNGDYGAACNKQQANGMTTFSYCVASSATNNATIVTINCIDDSTPVPTCKSAPTATMPPTNSASRSHFSSIIHHLLSFLFIN